MRLKDRVAIVTGGGRGIGRAIVKRFAAEGASVLIAQRDVASAEATLQDVRGAGGVAAFTPTDVSQRDSVEHMAAEAVRLFGRIDILVSNAAKLGLNGHFLEVPQENWDEVIATNLTGCFMCGQVVARVMARQKSGSILNVSSINGILPLPHCAAYASAKGGVNLLTLSMAIDLAAYGIRVNAIIPGPIQSREDEDAAPRPTKATLMGRVGLTREVASAALFLASDEASFITGQSITVDGGNIINAYGLYDSEQLRPKLGA